MPQSASDGLSEISSTAARGAAAAPIARKLTTEEARSCRYYVKDHLGSVRTVVDATGEVKETRDYYPFGLRMPGRHTVEDGEPAREDFTGHERDETHLLYAGARRRSSARAV